MLVDGFTVLAQVVNFLILVLLLRRFLYGPVIRAMDKREEKIRTRLEDADRRSREAEETRDTYRKKNREIDEQRKALVEEARDEAEKKKKEWLAEAREDADRARRRWLDALDRDRESVLRDLHVRASAQVFSVARRALADLADTELEERMAGIFAERLKGLDDDALKAMRASVKEAGEVVVETCFEPSASAKQTLTRAVHEHVAKEADIRYETSDDVVGGVQLRTADSLAAWSLQKYLDDLEADVSRRLERRTAAAQSSAEEEEEPAEGDDARPAKKGEEGARGGRGAHDEKPGTPDKRPPDEDSAGKPDARPPEQEHGKTEEEAEDKA